jgi:DNA polymerase-3 subunit delta
MSSSRSSERAVPRVALLEGPEATLREAALEDLRARALAGAPQAFNEDRFDLAAGVEPGAISAAARTHPVLAPARLVRVRGLDDRRAARFLEEELPAYLEDPPDTTCLVLEARKVDRRQKWVKQVQKLGEIVSCSGPTRPAELRAWIEARARALGKKPGSGVAAALLELVGPDLDRLAREIDKLVLHAGDAPALAVDDVAELTGQLRPRALYELTDQIGERRLGPALRTLSQLLDQGEPPLVVLSALANHFRRLIRAGECRPPDAATVSQRLGVHPFAAGKLVEQGRRFDAPRLRRCLDLVRRTDEALKGAVPLEPRQAVESLVLAVCA